MIPHLRRLVRRLGRTLRPVLVLALVVGQCVTAFGYPVVVRTDELVRRCGCKVRGPSERCCCGTRECCGGVAAKPIPAPEPPSCPKCKKNAPAATPATPSSSLKWLPRVAAHAGHGDNPLGFAAEGPTIPPAVPPAATAEPRPTDTLPLSDDGSGSRHAIPPDPPPRRG